MTQASLDKAVTTAPLSRCRLSRALLLRGAIAAAALPLAALPLPGPAQPKDNGPVFATQDLYLKISRRDSSVLQYLPPQGFSEITGAGERHQVDARAFEKLFASPLAIDLHAEDLQVESFGTAAIVTGTRVGSLTPPGQAPKEERHAFSMVWTQGNGAGPWRLRHVQLSGPLPPGAAPVAPAAR